jgi:hypothetical protein
MRLDKTMQIVKSASRIFVLHVGNLWVFFAGFQVGAGVHSECRVNN